MQSTRVTINDENSQNKETKSDTFSATDADVIFRSVDGIIFAIHRKNLETHTGGFPPSEFETHGEVVQLTEDASTLELLFQFVYPKRPPDLDDVEFGALLALAEAAEKYEVHGLMYICRKRFRNILPDHGIEIVEYAGKHDYPELVGVMAPLMLAKPLAEVLAILPPHLFAAWVLYQEHWHNVRISATTDRTISQSCWCSQCSRSTSIILRRMGAVTSFRDLATTFHIDTTCCGSTLATYKKWREAVEREIKSIPEYTKFLDRNKPH